MLKGILYWLQFKYHNSTNERKRLFLIRQGAEIGEGTRILSSTQCFSTEPYLVSVGIDSLISVNVLLVPHDGGVKVLNGYNNVGGGSILPSRMIRWGVLGWVIIALLATLRLFCLG